MAGGEDEIGHFLEAMGHHPWSGFEFIRMESGLSGFKAGRAKRQTIDQGLVEVIHLASSRQAKPAARYALTAAGSRRVKLRHPRADQRAATLLAAPHLERVRGLILSDPAIRERMVWSISPWRPGKGLILDGLACMRNSRQRQVLVAFAVPPEGAAVSWWILWLLRLWFRIWRSREDWGAVLAVMAVPFNLHAIPMCLHPGSRRKTRAKSASAPAYFLADGEAYLRLGSATAWSRLPELGRVRSSPWNDPTLSEAEREPDSLLSGRIPATARPRSLLQWAGKSRHAAAHAICTSLRMTPRDNLLLEALLQYPALTADELALAVGMRPRSVRRSLGRLGEIGLAETLPQPGNRHRSVLTMRGIDLLAIKAMQTPARFRTCRAWATDPDPLTRSPRHMQYILDFMLALRRASRLGVWNLVQARYAYDVAVVAGDLKRPRHIEIIPDSQGILQAEGREIPFWLEIDRATRYGASLTRQLEKYILARFGYAPSDPLPLLLYVVAEGGETRARLIARRLVELTAHYRLKRMPAILITTWELLTDGDHSRPPDPIRPVWRLPFRWTSYLVPVPPAPAARVISDGGLQPQRGLIDGSKLKP
jgi:DNA-binding MarR family transcriptional regulator